MTVIKRLDVFDSEQDTLDPAKAPHYGPAFLDCGAYSVLTGLWDELPLEAYAEFVRSYEQSFRLIAAPDVIPNPRRTLDNFRQFVRLLGGDWDTVKDRVVVTLHLQDHAPKIQAALLAEAQACGCQWVAIGGIVAPGTSLQERYVGVQNTLNLIRASGDWRVHLFGGYSAELIYAARPDSVDSATYVQAARTLTISMYDVRTGELVKAKLPRDSEKDAMQIIMVYLKRYAPWFVEQFGEQVIYDELLRLPDAVRLWAVNMASIPNFERQVRADTGVEHFTYYTTVGPSQPVTLTRYSLVAQQMFAALWRDRTLVAFPSFWQGDDRPIAYGRALEYIFRK